ncbi:hypothetical protein LXL04_030343 [Taraxacum kok-saghyz]
MYVGVAKICKYLDLDLELVGSGGSGTETDLRIRSHLFSAISYSHSPHLFIFTASLHLRYSIGAATSTLLLHRTPPPSLGLRSPATGRDSASISASSSLLQLRSGFIFTSSIAATCQLQLFLSIEDRTLPVMEEQPTDRESEVEQPTDRESDLDKKDQFQFRPVPTSSYQVQFQFQKFRIWSDQFQFQIPKPQIRQFQFQFQIQQNRPKMPLRNGLFSAKWTFYCEMVKIPLGAPKGIFTISQRCLCEMDFSLRNRLFTAKWPLRESLPFRRDASAKWTFLCEMDFLLRNGHFGPFN